MAVDTQNPNSALQDARRQRMEILAQANGATLRDLWAGLDIDPICELLRGPETGLIALRGRIGGGGAPFNLGEATVTRTTVRLEDGTVGHAVVLGRDELKSKLAAIIDAIATDEAQVENIETAIIRPLKEQHDAADEKRRGEAAATKVEFFTMVRGED